MAAPTIDEVQLDPKIAYGSRGGPMYKTSVVEGDSGTEQRTKHWSVGRIRFRFSLSGKSKTQMNTLRDFFRARGGKAYGFRFKDWTDYEATDMPVAAIDNTHGQFTKTYGDVARTETRPIYKPVASTITLKRNGVAWASSGNWTLDATTGIVTYTASQAGQTITWSGEFDVPVRFDTDEPDIEVESQGSRNLDISVVELLD